MHTAPSDICLLAVRQWHDSGRRLSLAGRAPERGMHTLKASLPTLNLLLVFVVLYMASQPRSKLSWYHHQLLLMVLPTSGPWNVVYQGQRLTKLDVTMTYAMHFWVVFLSLYMQLQTTLLGVIYLSIIGEESPGSKLQETEESGGHPV